MTAGILLFNFSLKHVPGPKHTGPDGLSRRHRAPEDEDFNKEDSEEVEEEIDEVLSYGIWTVLDSHNRGLGMMMAGQVFVSAKADLSTELEFLRNKDSKMQDDDLRTIQLYLETLVLPLGTQLSNRSHFLK
jgi:hypothetical protein